MFNPIIFKRLIQILTHSVRLKSDQFQKQNHLKELLINMPRDRKHIEEAQKQRLRIKEKNARYTPGTVTLQVLGSGAPGSPASVYLFTDQSRYLFNCGEGTQRLAHEHKTKLARLDHIFMTRTSWNHLGGLPGLSLTVQDAGVPDLTLHGPHGLDEIFRGMRKFVVLKHLRVNTVNCENGDIYDDQVMHVISVPLRRSIDNSVRSTDRAESPHVEIDNTDYYAHERNGACDSPPLLKVVGEKQEENVVISYICKLKPRPGALNLEKCVEYGVPPGPLLGQLKNGLDVTLENGTLVRAEDVRGPTDPGPVFIFIDIPSEEYLESLVKADGCFAKYQATTRIDHDAAMLVVHFTPQEIMQTEIYRQFMDKFTPSTKHIVLNSTNKFSGYLAAHRIQWQLNQMNEFIFPTLKENFNIEPVNSYKKMKMSEDNESVEKKVFKPNGSNDGLYVNQANSLTCYHLRPLKDLDRSAEPVLNPQEYIDEINAIEGFRESLLELKTKFLKEYSNKTLTRQKELPKIIFLGTGSCIPNKTRNVSGILLQTSESSYILLDCGEGTWGQIIRFFGYNKAVEVLQKIKAVYISHLHADHHIGLIGILRIRRDLFGTEMPPIQLFAPAQIQSWLRFYNHRIEPISAEYNLIPNGDMISAPLNSDYIFELGIESISTCLVRHCPHAFGVAITLDKTLNNEPIKITYSGDTMPCNELVDLGANSTVLIHEATMEDELGAEAKFKMHSTVSQAIEQGVKMNAKFTILTHFSQRYAKIPRIENVLSNNVGIAFDNMEVTPSDLEYLHLMYPTLKIMFSEHCEEMEQKAIKRALRQERKRRSLSSPSPTR